VDWREEIPGVVTSSLLRPKSAELSDEAKAILVEAAAGDGHILHVRYMGGEEIQTNGGSSPILVARCENAADSISFWDERINH
jgi:hypothetical protein